MIETIALVGALMSGPVAAGTAVVEMQTGAAEIPKVWKPFAQCVAQRESHGNPRAKNPTSSAEGKWQFLDTQWRIRGGIEWIVLRQLKKQGMNWQQRQRIYWQLTNNRIKDWPEWAQDAAFVGVVTERSSGWRHWSLPGHRCQSMIPAVAA